MKQAKNKKIKLKMQQKKYKIQQKIKIINKTQQKVEYKFKVFISSKNSPSNNKDFIRKNYPTEIHFLSGQLSMKQEPKTDKFSQRQFEQKLNEVVKIVKQKEETSLELIQHLQQTLINSQQLSNLMFLQDQIYKHKTFMEKILKKNQQTNLRQDLICSAYQQNHQLDDFQRSLVRRVFLRILQLFRLFNEKVEKYSHFQKQISLHYKLAKPKLIKQFNLLDKASSRMQNILQLCRCLFAYLQNKFKDQYSKINKVIQLIENGQIHNIESAFICQHCKGIQKTNEVLKQEQKHKLVRGTSKNLQLIESLQQTQQKKYFIKQKEKINQKLKVMRQEAKIKQEIKKKRMKFANKYFSLYQHAMDVHKGHFIDDLIFLDEKQHSDQIRMQIQSRNKHNQTFIKQYIQQCVHKNMQHKIQQMRELIQPRPNDSRSEITQYSEINAQSLGQKKYAFDQVIQAPEGKVQCCKSNEYEFPNPKSHPELASDCEEKSEMKSFRITNPNKKPILPTPKSNPNLFSIKELNQIGQSSFNFVKFSMKNTQIQRARLPDISNRLFSMQQKHKSVKTIERQQSNMPPDNHLLIIKTSLTKPLDQKRMQKKTRIDESCNNHKIEHLISKIQKHNEKMQKKVQLNQINPMNNINAPNTIHSINSNNRNKKFKRSNSGNKIILQNNDNGASTKTLQINYTTGVSKKIKKFCEILTNGENHL